MCADEQTGFPDGRPMSASAGLWSFLVGDLSELATAVSINELPRSHTMNAYKGQTPAPGLPRPRVRVLLVIAGLSTLIGCASVPLPPAQELQAAELAITGAEQAGVADYASLELNQAREKLAGAQLAVQEEDMLLAQRLADEARVNAELASARTASLKAAEINDGMRQSIDALKQEMQRNTGSNQ